MSDAGAFEALLGFIEDEIGFATSHYNASYLDRRISSRMRRTGTEDYEAYLELLRSDPGEHDALLDSLSINVTGFFRNPEVWDGIAEVLASLTDRRETVTVWSAACADGREPYSVSLLARADPAIDDSSIRIVATDISEAALEKARKGHYRESKTVDIGDQLAYLDDYEQYVDRTAEGYRVDDVVKAPVRFEEHDLINDPPKSDIDLVICRNLFIYIDAEHKQSMLETLSASLRPGGFLVIGKAETIPPGMKTDFTVLDGRRRIYRCEPADVGRATN